MRRNRHDAWRLFCEEHRGLLARTGLLTSVTHSERRFRDWLAEGEVVASGAQISLGELTPEAWAAVYRFAAAYLRGFELSAPDDLFPAFRCEVRRRGDAFPR